MRKPEIDALKALAIVGVLIAHMSFESRFEASTIRLVSQLQGVFGWCVIAFFFASGLLLKAPLPQSLDAILAWTRKRAARLLVPCIVFSVLYRFALQGLHRLGLVSRVEALPHDVAGGLKFVFLPIDPQFYFLPYLFFISVALVLLARVIPRGVIYWGATAGFGLSALFLALPNQGYGPFAGLVPVYAYAFVAGFVLSEETGKPRLHPLVGLLAAVAFAAWWQASRVPLYLPLTIALWLLLRYLPPLAGLLSRTQLGQHSGSIYVWHAPILFPFVSIVGVKLLGGQPLVLVPMLVLTIGLSIAMGLIVAKVRFLRFLRF